MTVSPLCRSIVRYLCGIIIVIIAMFFATYLSANIQESSFCPTFAPPKMKYSSLLKRDLVEGQENLNQFSDIIRQNSDKLPPAIFLGKNLSQICERHSTEEDPVCIPPYKNIETKLTSAAKYGLGACVIQKSMSTVMTAIMCYLYNEDAFKKAGRQFVNECHTLRFCENKNEYGSHKMLISKEGKEAEKWKLLLVARDPVDRFLSGYIDKCIRKPKTAGFCNGCGRNMTCFLITEYNRIREQVIEKDFRKSFEDKHFFPQSWRCHLGKFGNRFRFLKYSNNPSEGFLEQLNVQLREQNVSSQGIKFISDQLKMGRTIHSTVDSEARTFLEERLRKSRFLMEYLIRIFYFDFTIFNFQVPHEFK